MYVQQIPGRRKHEHKDQTNRWTTVHPSWLQISTSMATEKVVESKNKSKIFGGKGEKRKKEKESLDSITLRNKSIKHTPKLSLPYSILSYKLISGPPRVLRYLETQRTLYHLVYSKTQPSNGTQFKLTIWHS
ncbi:hypothetical protein M9H77_27516 [Catharanthus roseus]|uniref:Uncharacterized protein n=1 Tax=Catharanthus roseus TaxID=4058 RepID=A0ACC0ACQ6_CATRO|nr:hypothetical protein M9H77_27516 [Catharanthus roseus]